MEANVSYLIHIMKYSHVKDEIVSFVSGRKYT